MPPSQHLPSVSPDRAPSVARSQPASRLEPQTAGPWRLIAEGADIRCDRGTRSRLLTQLADRFGLTTDNRTVLEMRHDPDPASFWRVLREAAEAWTQNVESRVPILLHSPRARFYPLPALLEASNAWKDQARDAMLTSEWLLRTLNTLQQLQGPDYQAWVEASRPPAPQTTSWTPSAQTWLTATPDLQGEPRPLVVQTSEATAPQAGEALLLTRPGEIPWSVTVVGPAFALEEPTPEVLHTLEAMDLAGMAWSQWTSEPETQP